VQLVRLDRIEGIKCVEAETWNFAE
jgi:hypothetical protein